MNFTYESFEKLINLLRDNGYHICNYDNWKEMPGRKVILRHDIDNSIGKAVDLSNIEHKVGAHSTFFVLLSSDFYNVFSLRNIRSLDKILQNDSLLGLHFDEMRYPDEAGNPDRIIERIIHEKRALELALGIEINMVSMHRPTKEIINADLKIPGMINSYNSVFFREFKYLSDSRRRWREPVEDIIKTKEYDKLHILTHAFWYSKNETDIGTTVESFVNHANHERYLSMSANITDFESIMSEKKIR